MRAPRILVSGATGVVGNGLMSCLFEQGIEAEIVCLVRSRKAEAEVLDRFGGHENLSFLFCDLTDEDSVAKAIATVEPTERCVGVHCAADVAWDKTIDEVKGLNIDGSLSFARILASSSATPQMIYVSSAYTAMENWAYRNAYEASKAEAERQLRATFTTMPIATFSCSLVIGHSSTGEIHRYHGLFPLIRFLAMVRPPFLVGRRDCLIDLVPVDWVSEQLAALTRRAMIADVHEPVVAAAGASRVPAMRMIDIIEDRIAYHLDALGVEPRSHSVDILPHRRWAFLRRSVDRWQPPGLALRDFRLFDKIQSIYGPYTESDLVQPPLGVTRDVPDPERALVLTTDHWLDVHSEPLAARYARLNRGLALVPTSRSLQPMV